MSEAVIARISVRPHFNTKYTNIQLGTVLGHDIIVSKDVKEGDLGVYFDTEAQLSEDFCLKNKLLRKHPETGEELGGYLETSRRVRALKLCDVKSDGLWLPITALHSYPLYNELKLGDRFQSLGGVEIVTKYYSKATRALRAKFGGSPSPNKVFPKHYDTPKLQEVWPTLQAPFFYTITEKVHGTSQRQSYQLADRVYDLPWQFKEVEGKLVPVTETKKEWLHLLGTRNVVIGTIRPHERFVTKESYRSHWANKLQPFIHKNEVLYYEIVGYEESGKSIMADQSTTKLKDKEMEKKYGKVMHYNYGNVVGNSQAYLYRVAVVNEDGIQFEQPWSYVKRRAEELGIPIVPIIEEGVWGSVDAWEDMAELQTQINNYVDGKSLLSSTHIREGVCVRVENTQGIKVMKYKSFEFGVLEGYLKEDEDFVDTEEVS